MEHKRTDFSFQASLTATQVTIIDPQHGLKIHISLVKPHRQHQKVWNQKNHRASP
jgi:hypothetical protein